VESPAVVATLGARLTSAFTLIKEGPGILALNNAANDYTGVTQVNNGTLRPSTTGSLSRFSNVSLATRRHPGHEQPNCRHGFHHRHWPRYPNNGTTGALLTGFDNTSFVFSGRFGSGNQTSATFSLNEIGTGTMTIDSAAGTGTIGIGTFSTSQGTSILSGAGSAKFTTYNATDGGTLILDNSGTNLNNRLGGTDFAVGATLVRNLTLNGGEFKIIGNSGADTLETMNLGTLGSLNSAAGGSILTLDADPARSLTMTFGTAHGHCGR